MSEKFQRTEVYGALGEYAYHYTSSTAAFAYVLPRRELRFSRLAEMRDPVENKDWVQVLFGNPAWSVDKIRELEASANAVAYETKILSVTVDGASEGRREEHVRGYARPRMWEQYAENHQGVCLVFDHERLKLQIEEQCAVFAPTAGRRRAIADLVSYDDGPLAGHEEARSLDANQLAAIGGKDLEQALEDHLIRHAPELFFRKLRDWQTEQEYRYVVIGHDIGRIAIDYGDTLRAVILGAGFPAWQIVGAAAVCKGAGVELRQMRWGARIPGVFDPIDEAVATLHDGV